MERIKHAMPVLSDEQKSAALEGVWIGDRIGTPEIVLADAVTQGHSQVIEVRLLLAIESKLGGLRPTFRGQYGIEASAFQLGANGIDFGRQIAPPPQPAGRVNLPQWRRPFGRGRTSEVQEDWLKSRRLMQHRRRDQTKNRETGDGRDVS